MTTMANGRWAAGWKDSSSSLHILLPFTRDWDISNRSCPIRLDLKQMSVGAELQSSAEVVWARKGSGMAGTCDRSSAWSTAAQGEGKEQAVTLKKSVQGKGSPTWGLEG